MNRKQYLSWAPNLEQDSLIDPTKKWNVLWKQALNLTLLSSPYESTNKMIDPRRLAFIEYDDLLVSANSIERFMSGFCAWSFFMLTPTQTVALCNEWHPKDLPRFSLNIDGWTIIDSGE